MNTVCYTPIGTIHTPFREMSGMPIQAITGQNVAGSIELEPAYVQGLQDLDGFSHLMLVYHLHEMTSHQLVVTPFLDTQPRGIFATRGPKRPNPIGLSTVRLVRIEHNILYIEDLDILDGTPLLDLKPYVPHFDDRAGARIGWFDEKIANMHNVRADERYR